MLFISPDTLMMMMTIVILFRTMSVKNSLGSMLDKDNLKGDCCPMYFGGQAKPSRVVVLADKTIQMIELRAFFERNEDSYGC